MTARLTQAHQELIRLLAEIAVDAFINEETNPSAPSSAPPTLRLSEAAASVAPGRLDYLQEIYSITTLNILERREQVRHVHEAASEISLFIRTSTEAGH